MISDPEPSPRVVDAASEWFTPGRFAALLAGMLFALWPGLLLGTSSLVFRDFGIFTYPIAHYFRDCFWRGEIPLWNPYNVCGVPLVAQWNTQMLYPPALFYLLLPLPWSLNVFCLAHLFWGGLGMYFLAHRWTGNRFAASVAGVVFAFNGLAVGCLMWLSNEGALCWMPWVFWLVERGWRNGGRALVLAALAGGLQMLTGAPEFILLTWLLLGALLVEQSVKVRGGFEINWKLWGRFAAMALLVTGLAAAQLLPFLDLLTHSQRGAGYQGAYIWPMPLSGWVNFLVPQFYCYRIDAGVYFQNGQLWISSYYTGAATAVLAVIAARRVRRRTTWIFAGALALVVILAMGNPAGLYRLLAAVSPLGNFMRYSIKFVGAVPMLMGLLAALALAWWLARPEEARARETKFLFHAALLAALIALLAVGWEWSHPLGYAGWASSWFNASTRMVFMFAIFAGLVLAARAPETKRRWLLAGVLVAFWGDLATQMPSVNPEVPSKVYQPGLATLPEQVRLGEGRLMVSPQANFALHDKIAPDLMKDYLLSRVGVYNNCNLIDEVPKIDGFFSVYPRELRESVSPIYMSTNRYPAGLADFLGARLVTAPGELFHWEIRSNAMPLITAGQRPVFMKGRDDTLSAMFDRPFAPRDVVLLPENLRGQTTVTTNTTARVSSIRFAPHRVECEVDAAESSLVVIAQSYYHRWKPYLNGTSVPLLRANHGFQAVQVPAGKHRLELRYEDTPFWAGVGISVATLLVCGAMWRYSASNSRTSSARAADRPL
ncbi:MAG: hypothetical protein HZA89_10425 [Verrucomicrobia bacterium]|nr:hypothetical protein [Verrucomicrobiota bacterium]